MKGSSCPLARSGNFVFCCGSLRPDDNSGMPWTETAVQGPSGQRAVVLNAKLCHDSCASMVLLPEAAEAGSENANVVHGWVLAASNDELFDQKMKRFDAIEGFNEENPNVGLCQRSKVVARLQSSSDSVGEENVGQENELLEVFCYHQPDCDKSHPIESGDWLKRQCF